MRDVHASRSRDALAVARAPATRSCCPARCSPPATRRTRASSRSCARRACCRTGWRDRCSSTRARRPAAAGRPVGAVGPTTAKRMDAWTPALLDAGIVATIGKGARSEAVREACAANGAVYFAAVGGAAALLATHVTAAETVAYPELGTEALVRLDARPLPGVRRDRRARRRPVRDAPREWRERTAGVDGGRVHRRSRAARARASRRRSRCSPSACARPACDVIALREPGGTVVGDRVARPAARPRARRDSTRAPSCCCTRPAGRSSSRR